MPEEWNSLNIVSKISFFMKFWKNIFVIKNIPLRIVMVRIIKYVFGFSNSNPLKEENHMDWNLYTFL